MGRISEKNPRYRTKEEIAKDLAFVLASHLSYGTKYAVLADATWVWTEFYGKIRGCPHWSKMAIMQDKVNPRAKLRHEHAVPKKVVIELLMNLEPPTLDRVWDILNRFLIGVVVTPEEDAVLNSEFSSKMPPEFYDPKNPRYQDPLLRYKRYNIEVILRHNH